MNLLVTGGCGFIGSNFIRRRLAERAAPLRRLVNLDKLTYAGNPDNLADLADDPRYAFVQGDIADEALVADLLARHRIEAIVNFAAESHVDRSLDAPEPFIQTNIVGTLRLLKAAQCHWSKLDEKSRAAFRLLHISTDEVYGALAPADPPFTEASALAPNSPYAASKAAGDHLVRAFRQSYGLPTIITNCSNNYGPYQFPEKLIPLVILNALDGRPLPIYGDGRQVRDWLHVDDHADALWLVLRQGRAGETYNIGGGNERANLDLVQRLCALLDAKAPRVGDRGHAAAITHVPDRPGHDRRYAVDSAKLRRELGWQPRIDFEGGLAQTVDWYLANRAWCDRITAQRYARARLGLAAQHS
jgi:dTDP-glucose 4,6-dehydratase